MDSDTDWDDSGEPPDLDEITLLHLPPPEAAGRIPDEGLPHVANPDDPEPEPEEEEPWWRQETGG